jgi:hypothetical protein
MAAAYTPGAHVSSKPRSEISAMNYNCWFDVISKLVEQLLTLAPFLNLLELFRGAR